MLKSIKKEITWNKIVSLLLLTAVLFLILLNVDQFKTEVNDAPYGEKDPFVWVDFKGNHTVEHSFVAKTDELQRANLGFRNHERLQANGEVVVSILDASGNTVGSSTLSASNIVSMDDTVFDFASDSEKLNAGDVTDKYFDNSTQGISLQKGGTYTLVVTGKNIRSDSWFDIKMMREDGTPSLQDGECLYTSLKYFKKDNKVLAAIILAFIVGFLFLLVPLGRISSILETRGIAIDLNHLFSRLLFIFTPLTCLLMTFVIMEKRTTWIVESLSGFRFYMNLYVIGLVWILVWLIVNRIKWVTIITTAIWFAFGLANYLLIQFRNAPLTFSDFANFGTALDVVQNYEITLTEAGLCAIAIAALNICIAFGMNGYRGLAFKKRLLVLLAACLYAGSFYYVFFKTDYIEKNNLFVGGFRPRVAYANNGYPLSFVVTIASSRIDAPQDYSAKHISEFTAEYPSDQVTRGDVSKKRPNIIIIMNESLADLSSVSPIKTEKDYMPFLHSLKDNTIKGNLHVSVFGGTTANSEYELLTGNSTGFFPINTAPFNTRVKKDTPSLVKQLKQIGYGGMVAFHPGMRDSYNRNNAYPALGFEKHISLEDLSNPELVRAFVSDSYDYKIVEQEYEAYRKSNTTDPFFMFNVTIQNHGNYALKSGIVEDKIHVTDPEFNSLLLTQYLNLVKISDDALSEIVNYFQSVKEPTVLLIYGDHQPNLGEDVDKAFENRLLKAGCSTAEVTDKRYQTPFFLWANYDIPEQDGIEISDNYLSAFLLKTLGLPMTGYDKFRLEMWKSYPFYTAVTCSDSSGTVYSAKDMPDSDLIQQYRQLEYNNIVDRKNREENFFRLKE